MVCDCKYRIFSLIYKPLRKGACRLLYELLQAFLLIFAIYEPIIEKASESQNLRGFLVGAEDEVRTRDPQLGRLMLYRLSYFRIKIKVGEDGFEPPKVKTSRFTVCPIWPLWYSPKILIEFSSPEQT